MITAAFLGITGTLIGKNMFRGGLYKSFLRNANKFHGTTKEYYVSEINRVHDSIKTVFSASKYKYTPRQSNMQKEWLTAKKEFLNQQREARNYVYSLGNREIFKKNPKLRNKLLKNYESNVALDKGMTKSEKGQIKNIIKDIKSNKHYKEINKRENIINLQTKRASLVNERVINKNISDMLSTAKMATIGFDGAALSLTGISGINMYKEGKNG